MNTGASGETSLRKQHHRKLSIWTPSSLKLSMLETLWQHLLPSCGTPLPLDAGIRHHPNSSAPSPWSSPTYVSRSSCPCAPHFSHTLCSRVGGGEGRLPDSCGGSPQMSKSHRLDISSLGTQCVCGKGCWRAGICSLFRACPGEEH